MEQLSLKKRVRDDSDDSGFDTPEVKRIREDLLDSFDDTDFNTASHELDSFMKSFEEEIVSGKKAATVTVVDLTSESGDSQPDLGYLLEASDDELGLPPSTTEGENVVEEKTELFRVASDSSELSGGGGGEFWGFEGEIPSFDSFEFGIVDAGSYYNGGSEYVALDGLFDYSDLCFGSTDFTET